VTDGPLTAKIPDESSGAATGGQLTVQSVSDAGSVDRAAFPHEPVKAGFPPGAPAERAIKSPAEVLGEQVLEIRRDIEQLKNLKEKLAEYNFQTITIILGVLTLVAIVPFVLIHGYAIATGTIADLILGVLVLDTVMAAFWMWLWFRLNFPPSGNQPKSSKTKPPEPAPPPAS
jgi:hypothetical protein